MQFGLFYIACFFALLQAALAVSTIAPRDDVSNTQIKGESQQKYLLGGTFGYAGAGYGRYGLGSLYSYGRYNPYPFYGYGNNAFSCGGYGYYIGYLSTSCYGSYPYPYGALWKKDAPAKTDDASA